jgi:hypothetical protein
MVSNKVDSCCPTLIDYYHLSNLLGYKNETTRIFSFQLSRAMASANRPNKFSTFYSTFICKVSFYLIRIENTTQ